MFKDFNLKGDFSNQNFKIEFLKIAKTEVTQYNSHATRCQPVCAVDSMLDLSHVMRKPVDNKDADQPAHLRSLISAFVVPCLDSVTSLVSISNFKTLSSPCN